MQNHQHYLSQNYRNLEWEKCVSIVGNTYNLGEFLKLRYGSKVQCYFCNVFMSCVAGSAILTN